MRDPRIDPIPGDVLDYRGRPGDRYKVVSNDGVWVVDTPQSPSNPDFGEELHNRVEEWRMFFLSATVIHTAPDSGGQA